MNIPELIERLREWPTGLDLTDIDKAVEALFAQQAVIEQMCEALAVVLQCRHIGYETMTEARERKIREALALQPSLTALREHDAEVERRVLANAKVKIPTDTMEQAFAREYDKGYAAGKAAAERIRKGEQK